jgi:hypothetical protein
MIPMRHRLGARIATARQVLAVARIIVVVAGAVPMLGVATLPVSAATGPPRAALDSREAPASTAWRVQRTPNPGVKQGTLSGIACLSLSACTAVGTYTDNTGDTAALAETWNGSTWAIQTTPDPSGSTGSTLSGVACTSPSACTAVGSYTDNAGHTATLAETWNGTSWSLQTTPDPSGASGSALSGVACTTPDACTAVGTYTVSARDAATLAERWNGASWSIEQTPNPTGSRAIALSGVACTSDRACTAVGSYLRNTGDTAALAETWNGITWSIEAIPNPNGSTGSTLSGVACTSRRACTAVGSYANNTDARVTLAEAWNGAEWSVEKTPNPAVGVGAFSVLLAVGCTSTRACTAVGSELNSDTSDDTLTLAETWNGTAWSIEKTANPGPATFSLMSGVACISARACTSVGTSYDPTPGRYFALAEAWNGTAWSIEKTPDRKGSIGANLSGVACPSTSTCIAVGSYNTAADVGSTFSLAEVTNGTTWSIQKTPNPPSAGSALSSVACSSPDACTAVGFYLTGRTRDPGFFVTLAEGWNGTTWAIEQTANADATANFLSGVACTAPDECTAVGNSETGSRQSTLAETWNGTSWSIQKTPNPKGFAVSTLTGVACTSSRACTAVGFSANSTGGDSATLAERWNGKSWAIEETPNLPGSSAISFSGIACPSAHACAAVGTYDDSSGDAVALAETWNGSSWSIEDTPNPKDSTAASLSGVACFSAWACTAVGTSGRSPQRSATLAERWDGTSWTIQATVNPKGAVASSLEGVACTSTAACSAVGDYGTSRTYDGARVTLAETRS